MFCRMVITGDEALVRILTDQILDIYKSKQSLKQNVTKATNCKDEIVVNITSDDEEGLYIPVFLFTRDLFIKRSKDLEINIGFGYNKESKDYRLIVRNFVCNVLTGYKEFVNNSIVVSDDFDMKDSRIQCECGCSIVIGAEANLVPVIGFIRG